MFPAPPCSFSYRSALWAETVWNRQIRFCKPFSWELGSKWVRERANKWAQHSSYAKRAARSKGESEWCELTSEWADERMAQYPLRVDFISFPSKVRRRHPWRCPPWRCFTLPTRRPARSSSTWWPAELSFGHDKNGRRKQIFSSLRNSETHLSLSLSLFRFSETKGLEIVFVFSHRRRWRWKAYGVFFCSFLLS